MKKSLFIILLVAFSTLNAQYSGYYTVNENVNKNISTIDYEKLALINSENEKSRVENLIYPDDKQKRIASAIASDPIKAYEYGYQNTFQVEGEDAEESGFKKLKIVHRTLPSSLFVNASVGRFVNISLDGITTEITFYMPKYHTEKAEFDAEKKAKMENEKVGELNEYSDGEKYFVLKKDINPATVYGVKGYSGTLIFEDDDDYEITDNFSSFNKNEGNGVSYFVEVSYYGDKNEVTFEQLEGRKYYFKRLIDKLIATAYAGDFEY